MAEIDSAAPVAAPETNVTDATEAPAQAVPEASAQDSGGRDVGERASNGLTPAAPEPDKGAFPESEKASADILTGEDEGAPDDGKASGVLGAPEGGYELSHADGSKAMVDDAVMSKFAEVAKELNLSQDAAQKIVSNVEPALSAMVERNRVQWADASRKDAEFGGAEFKTNMKAVNRVYKQTTTQEFRDLLKTTGLSNHPEVIRHFYRLSKTLSDGSFITSGATEADKRGQQFYKGMNP